MGRGRGVLAFSGVCVAGCLSVGCSSRVDVAVDNLSSRRVEVALVRQMIGAGEVRIREELLRPDEFRELGTHRAGDIDVLELWVRVADDPMGLHQKRRVSKDDSLFLIEDGGQLSWERVTVRPFAGDGAVGRRRAGGAAGAE